jgi:hypothetical protein
MAPKKYTFDIFRYNMILLQHVLASSNSFVNITFLSYHLILAGVPSVAGDDQWRNRIAILCIMSQKQGAGINCGNVSE